MDGDAECKGCISDMENMFPLPPVSPCDSGDGLPYAPVDWPNAGDVWGWKVGNRFSTSGFFRDRWLYTPKRFHRRQTLGSIPSIIRYLQSEHPNANIDAFFASFSWKVPVKKQFLEKVMHTPEKVVEGGSQGKTTRKLVVHGQHTRKSSRLTSRFAQSTKYTNTVIDLCSDRDWTEMGDGTTTNPNRPQINSPDSSKCSALCSTPTSHSLDISAEAIMKDLDGYMSSLDSILAGRFSLPTAELIESMAQARKELSEILDMDLSALLSAKDLVSQIATLSCKLQSDSTITAQELSLLNLIAEIPAAIKDFEEAKKVEADAEKFFADLEANISMAANLKSKYNKSRNKAAYLDAEMNSASMEVEGINEQITILKSQRAQARIIMEKTRRKMARVTSKQDVIVHRLLDVEREVQLAQSEKSKWEQKKKTATYLEARILEKFAPLERFSFYKPLITTFVDKFDS